MDEQYKNEEKEPPSANEGNSGMRFYSSQEEQELVRLRENMSQSYTDKFRSFVRMIKLGNLMKKATIHHKE